MIITSEKEFADPTYSGRVLYDRQDRKFWVNIPKNASNSVSNLLLTNGWKEANWKRQRTINSEAYRGFAVIRDPIKRWRGAIGEISSHKLEHGASKEELDEWFDNAHFMHEDYYDIHLVSQRSYCAGLEIHNMKFFRLPDVGKVPAFLGYESELRHMNQSTNPMREYIMERIDNLMTHEVIDMLHKRYNEDFEFFDLITQERRWY